MKLIQIMDLRNNTNVLLSTYNRTCIGTRKMAPRPLSASLLALLVAACTSPTIKEPSPTHLRAEEKPAASKNLPKPVTQSIAAPKPRAVPKTETYSVVVNNVLVHDLLFALARDAKLNVDIHPGINGNVTLNAIDQTLPQLLNRITKQIDMRYEIDGPNLSVMPDKPFLKTYSIDFLNMARVVKSTISTTTQIATASTTASGTASGGQASASGGNTASTLITSDTKNDLMESLISNVTDMLKEEDRIRYRAAIEVDARSEANARGSGRVETGVSSGSKTSNIRGETTESPGPAAAAAGSGNQSLDARTNAIKRYGEYEPSVSVFANRETGALIVRATSRQHEKVQQFIDQVMRTAKRQVLIEATIVEVNLNDAYKQGINWSALRLGSQGFQISQQGITGLSSANPLNIFTLAYDNPVSRLGNLSAEVSLLESFGNVKVLSSPKLSVMNNQTATLKVADNKIYFTVKAETTTNTNNSLTTYTTTPHAISVGFIMNVTPQITESDEVTINVRPTITRITGFVNDPNPSLAALNIVNQVPEIQTREMESIIKIQSGQVAVMGGLMQDQVNNSTDGIPGIQNIPVIGNIFKHRNDVSSKSELVIFLRATVLRDPSVSGDYAKFRDILPREDFFTNIRDSEGRSPQPPARSEQ